MAWLSDAFDAWFPRWKRNFYTYDVLTSHAWMHALIGRDWSSMSCCSLPGVIRSAIAWNSSPKRHQHRWNFLRSYSPDSDSFIRVKIDAKKTGSSERGNPPVDWLPYRDQFLLSVGMLPSHPATFQSSIRSSIHSSARLRPDREKAWSARNQTRPVVDCFGLTILT